VLSTGLQILVVLDQLTGQQTKELVAGAPTLRTPFGNLIAKLLYEHIVPPCFFSPLLVCSTGSTSTNMHVAPRDLEPGHDLISRTPTPSFTITRDENSQRLQRHYPRWWIGGQQPRFWLTRSGLNIWIQGDHLGGHVQTGYRMYPALVCDTCTGERRVDS